MRTNVLFALVSGFLILVSFGCGAEGPGGPERLPTVPAAGVVTYQGKPLANASVSFQHTSGVVTAGGKTDSDGRFTLSTYGENDGAPAGSYRVTVAVNAVQEIEPGVLAPEPPGGFKSPIPDKYANPDTSGLEVEIPAEGTTDLKIELR